MPTPSNAPYKLAQRAAELALEPRAIKWGYHTPQGWKWLDLDALAKEVTVAHEVEASEQRNE